MNSRLHWIKEWPELARECRYHVESLAQRAETSPRQLQRYFKQWFGTSPKSWLDQLRTDDALLLLRKGRKVKDAARHVGIDRPATLARMMRRVRGKSPRELAVEEAERNRLAMQAAACP